MLTLNFPYCYLEEVHISTFLQIDFTLNKTKNFLLNNQHHKPITKILLSNNQIPCAKTLGKLRNIVNIITHCNFFTYMYKYNFFLLLKK